MLGINKILAFVRRQVGLRTDAADSAGSLHAKIKTVINNRSPIKSIQRGVSTVKHTPTVNVTISSVDLSKSVLIINSASTAQHGPKGTLTSGTNIAFSFAAIDITTNSFVDWQVIEFY